MLLSVMYVTVVSALQRVPPETHKPSCRLCFPFPALICHLLCYVFSLVRLCVHACVCLSSTKLCTLTYCSAVKHASCLCVFVCICRCSDLHTDCTVCVHDAHGSTYCSVRAARISEMSSHLHHVLLFMSTLLNVCLKSLPPFYNKFHHEFNGQLFFG